MNSDEVKACCADAYAKDVVALLLGDSYHPGGTALTRRLADHLQLTAASRVLDVASGRGTTALLFADAYGVRVDGVDYSAANTALAQGAAQAAGLAERAAFTTGDAEHLPYEDGMFDAVVCECALCTFPDKAKAAAEFARVLKPGGRVGITDVTADPGRLPPELLGLGARIACVADARPLYAYAEILTRAFGALLGQFAQRLAPAVVLGLAYGAVWWTVGALWIMPANMGMPVFEWNDVTSSSLGAHLVYGLLAGVTFSTLAQLAGKRTGRAAG
ncbi:class I SAM-dependent methyltransferase [Streptomyces sp. NPDC048581]|uniref:class I SAM-dependent methyltransferase n=1 Tax=Streptomyces sp. NPDC048581 TaxID=3365572 RepID=UPI003711A5EE